MAERSRRTGIMGKGWTDRRTNCPHNMGINRRTLTDWKNKYTPIFLTLKRGKEVVDIQVENVLYVNFNKSSTSVQDEFKMFSGHLEPLKTLINQGFQGFSSRCSRYL